MKNILRISKKEPYLFPVIFTLTVAPICIYYSFGNLPYLNYEWVADSLPKIERDFQNMSKAFGVKEAEKFRSFYITNLATASFFWFALVVFFLGKIKKGTYVPLLRVTIESGNRGTKKETIAQILVLACIVFFVAILLILPAPVNFRFDVGYLKIEPGFRSKMLTSVWFSLLTLVLANFFTDVFDRKKTDAPKLPKSTQDGHD